MESSDSEIVFDKPLPNAQINYQVQKKLLRKRKLNCVPPNQSVKKVNVELSVVNKEEEIRLVHDKLVHY